MTDIRTRDGLGGRGWLPLAVLLACAGCQDTAAPFDQPNVAGPQFRWTSSAQVHVLQQSATAPPLETYEVSFWAYVGKASTIAVRYQPAAGQSQGDPFLQLDIPRRGLVAGAGGAVLERGDSVLVTLGIDPAGFQVHFQPSGVQFFKNAPAVLTMWYEHADPDLNGDGGVNGWDWWLERQLAVWYHAKKTWSRLWSKSDAMQQAVWAELYHFSEYAVSW